jgi:Cd2+/Zn2+-exporting ATPase
MPEQTLHIDAPLLIPGLHNPQDGCLERLNSALQNRRGIHHAHIEYEAGAPRLCLHYNPDLVSIEDVRQEAERAGTQIANRYHHEAIPVEGMDCSDCILVIEHSLGRMKGLLDVKASYTTQTVQVEYDAQQINRADLEKRLTGLGYPIPPAGARQWYLENRGLLFSLAAALFLLLGWLGEHWLGLPYPLSVAPYLAAFLVGGWDIAHHAWHSLRELRFDTDLLMIVAALGAATLGEWAEGALLITLFSLGHALEERSLEKARQAVRALASLTPKTALVRRGQAELEIPGDEVRMDDIVITRPGQRLAVDGIIISGSSTIDQSPITGESLPVDKAPGDTVFAGTINGQGALEIRPTRLARDSTLARIIQLVEKAQASKSPTQQMAERFMAWFVPLVIVFSVLLIIIPPLFGVPFRESFLRAMTLLVAASPCALALGAPSAILSGVARAARNGVLLKGGIHLENLGRLKAIAFDKTGTLTQGKPKLTDIYAIAQDGSLDSNPNAQLSQKPQRENTLLALAAAAESRSTHPLAQAVVTAARERDIAIPEASQASALNGRGFQAVVDKQIVHVGSLAFFHETGIPVPYDLEQQADRWSEQGKTVILISAARQISGALAVADSLRPEAAAAVGALHHMGIRHTVMLTGDNPSAAAHIAHLAGVSAFQASLMPEDKLIAVRTLTQKYGFAAMVGDGVNDAPALASATLGIAMGSAGSDAALEASDMALMSDDLNKLPFAIGLGQATRATIRQNLVIALGVIAMLMLASLTGWISIGWAIIFHEGSTVAVVLNSLRLLTFEPAYKKP